MPWEKQFDQCRSPGKVREQCSFDPRLTTPLSSLSQILSPSKSFHHGHRRKDGYQTELRNRSEGRHPDVRHPGRSRQGKGSHRNQAYPQRHSNPGRSPRLHKSPRFRDPKRQGRGHPSGQQPYASPKDGLLRLDPPGHVQVRRSSLERLLQQLPEGTR